MKTIALISVGSDYNGVPYYIHCVDKIKQLILEFNFDVRVLTDTPNEFENIGCTIYPYHNKIFNYFDKFFFSFSLIKELNRSVTYIDCDYIDYLLKIEKYRNLFSEEKVLYLTYWSVKISKEWISYQYFKDFVNDKWSTPIVEFLEYEKYDFLNLETIHERLFYFPFGLDYEKIQYTLEKIKPIFDYTSIYNKKASKDLLYGHGEGLALSYSLDVNNIKKERIENQQLFREKYDVIFKNRTKKLI
jgi:hypothetical protein